MKRRLSLEKRGASRRHVVSRLEGPCTWSRPSASACLGLFLATRDEPGPHPRAFRGRERVVEALDYGFLRASDAVRIDGRVSTAGRFLVAECLPRSLRDEAESAACTSERVVAWLSLVTEDVHVEIAARSATALEALGRRFVDGSGLSVGMADFARPQGARDAVTEAMAAASEILAQYTSGRITDGERYQKSLDVWASARAEQRSRLNAASARSSSLDALAAAGYATAPTEDARVLAGVAAKASGELFDAPIMHSRAEGLTAHELAMTCRAARGERLNRDARDRVAAALLHDLHLVLSGLTIVSRDCGTREGLRLRQKSAMDEGCSGLARDLRGRVLGEDVVCPGGETIACRGDLVTRALAHRIEASLVRAVLVRDPLGCLEREGVCATCFGLSPDDATWPAKGDSVGAAAAFSIAEESRKFVEHFFHIC